MSELTPVEVVTLAALSEEPGYGYELVQRIDALTDGRVRIRPGNLYRVIDRLIERGLVVEVLEPSPEDERRRYFKATARGNRAAAEELAMYARVLKRAPGLKERLADG